MSGLLKEIQQELDLLAMEDQAKRLNEEINYTETQSWIIKRSEEEFVLLMPIIKDGIKKLILTKEWTITLVGGWHLYKHEYKYNVLTFSISPPHYSDLQLAMLSLIKTELQKDGMTVEFKSELCEGANEGEDVSWRAKLNVKLDLGNV